MGRVNKQGSLTNGATPPSLLTDYKTWLLSDLFTLNGAFRVN